MTLRPWLVFSFTFAAFLLPRIASAQTTEIHWNECDGPTDIAFACEANTGAPYVLQWSVQPPAGIRQCIAVEATLDVRLCGRTSVPSWWEFKNPGSCRLNAASVVPSTLDGACTPMWPGSAVSLLGYQILNADVGAQWVRFRAVVAVPLADSIALDPATNYDMVQLRIARSASTGAGNCEGCQTPAMLFPTMVKLIQPTGVGDYYVPNQGWPSGVTIFNGYCPPPDPVRSSTWGRIKAQYR